MLTTSATTEIIDFIVNTDPTRVLEFKASSTTKNRVFSLIDRSKANQLNKEEQAELDHYFLLEHLMRLAKIRAYQVLNS
jgi:hypothetical protein